MELTEGVRHAQGDPTWNPVGAGVRRHIAFGDLLAVILFAKVSIPHETADLFRTVELNVTVLVSPFEEVVFT